MANEKQIDGSLRLRLDGKSIFDATSCTLNINRETTATTGTKDTAAGSNSKGTLSWDISFNGLGVYAGDGNGGHQFEDLIDYMLDDDPANTVTAEFVPSESDYQWYYGGETILTNVNGVFNFSEKATVSLTAIGTGPLNKIDKSVTAPATS